MAGHVFLYALMVVVFSLALLRQYGSGKGFSPFGVELMATRGYKIEWMMVPGDLLHYWLGFLLLGSILGHVTMAFVHRRAKRDDVLERMI